jgi:hypothetical protein
MTQALRWCEGGAYGGDGSNVHSRRALDFGRENLLLQETHDVLDLQHTHTHARTHAVENHTLREKREAEEKLYDALVEIGQGLFDHLNALVGAARHIHAPVTANHERRE